jgi:hypothetical protein
MNKLLNLTGGMPLFQGDFVFVDNAVRDALKGVLYEAALSAGGDLILGGCVVSVNGATTTMSSGYLLIAYEVVYFAGASWASGLGTNGTFSLITGVDATGSRTFANSTTQNPYQTRTASFAAGGVSGGPLDLSDLQRYSGVVYSILTGLSTSSTAFTMLAGWAKSASPNDPVLTKHFRQVSFVGDFIPGTITATSWTKITTLPSGYRPAKRVKFAAMGQNSTPANGVVFFDILTNGEVYAQASSATGWDVVSANISYVAA